MRLFFTVLFTLLLSSASAQLPADTVKMFKSNDYGWRYQRLYPTKAFMPPSDTVGNKYGFAQIGANVYTGNGSKWTAIGGGTTDTSSLSNRINNRWTLGGNAGTTAGTDFVGTTDSKALVFKTNNTERMRIGTSGEVNINYSLAVGNGGGDTILWCVGGDTYIGGSYNNQNHGHFNENYFKYTNADNTHEFLATTPAEFTVGLSERGTFGRRFYIDGGSARLYLGDVDDVNTSLKLVIDSDAGKTYVNSGTVGIGTDSPDSTLTVSGGLNISGGVRLAGIGRQSYAADSMLVIDATTGSLGYRTIPSSGSNYWTSLSGNIYNNTGTNVGIGTSTPISKFQVNGSIRLADTLLLNDGGYGPTYKSMLYKVDGPTTRLNGVYTEVSSNHPGGNVRLFTNGGFAIMTSGGQFSLSSYSPTSGAKLHVEGNGQVTGNLAVGSSTAPSAPLDITGDKFRVRTSKTPASATDTGNAGDICWDTNFIYVCTATNTWKRVGITSSGW